MAKSTKAAHWVSLSALALAASACGSKSGGASGTNLPGANQDFRFEQGDGGQDQGSKQPSGGKGQGQDQDQKGGTQDQNPGAGSVDQDQKGDTPDQDQKGDTPDQDQKGDTPDQKGDTPNPDQKRDTPDQIGDTPDQKGDTPNPDQKGDTPDQKGDTPNPDQKGDTPDQKGDTPDQKGDTPNPDQKGDTPDQKGDTPNPDQKGDTPDQKGDTPNPDQKGDTPNQGQRPDDTQTAECAERTVTVAHFVEGGPAYQVLTNGSGHNRTLRYSNIRTLDFTARESGSSVTLVPSNSWSHSLGGETRVAHRPHLNISTPRSATCDGELVMALGSADEQGPTFTPRVESYTGHFTPSSANGLGFRIINAATVGQVVNIAGSVSFSGVGLPFAKATGFFESDVDQLSGLNVKVGGRERTLRVPRSALRARGVYTLVVSGASVETLRLTLIDHSR